MSNIISDTIGSPINAGKALFDKSIPLWFRISMIAFGLLAWGTLIIELYTGRTP